MRIVSPAEVLRRLGFLRPVPPSRAPRTIEVRMTGDSRAFELAVLRTEVALLRLGLRRASRDREHWLRIAHERWLLLDRVAATTSDDVAILRAEIRAHLEETVGHATSC